MALVRCVIAGLIAGNAAVQPDHAAAAPPVRRAPTKRTEANGKLPIRRDDAGVTTDPVASYVMGGTVGSSNANGTQTRCAPNLFITSKAACKEAGQQLGLTLTTCTASNSQDTVKMQDCVAGTGNTSAEWTDGSTDASSDVSQSYIPKGCVYVPVSTDQAQRRRQLRWNNHPTSLARNDYASPLCYASGSFESKLEMTGSVCRLSQSDTTSHGGDTTCRVCPKTADMQACEQSCRNAAVCYGYEFRDTDNRCEIWSQPIGYKKPASSKWSCIRIRT
jgi:hypothetical protein